MNWKRWSLLAVAVIAVLLGVGYHIVFGYAVVSNLGDGTYVIGRENFLDQIGANVVLQLGENESVVVDSQLSALAAMTLAEVRKLSSRPVARVYITHWHPDHSGGIGAYVGEAKVIAHQNTLSTLESRQIGFGLTSPDSYHEFAARETSELPSETIKSQHTRGGIWAVHYPNAHTGGDLVVFLNKAVAIGDLVWPGRFPYVDLHNGGSVLGLEAALTNVLNASEPDAVFIPGHGDALSKSELTEYLEMVAATRSFVEERKEDGYALKDIISEGLPHRLSSWSGSLVPESVWITMIFSSL